MLCVVKRALEGTPLSVGPSPVPPASRRSDLARLHGSWSYLARPRTPCPNITARERLRGRPFPCPHLPDACQGTTCSQCQGWCARAGPPRPTAMRATRARPPARRVSWRCGRRKALLAPEYPSAAAAVSSTSLTAPPPCRPTTQPIAVVAKSARLSIIDWFHVARCVCGRRWQAGVLCALGQTTRRWIRQTGAAAEAVHTQRQRAQYGGGAAGCVVVRCGVRRCASAPPRHRPQAAIGCGVLTHCVATSASRSLQLIWTLVPVPHPLPVSRTAACTCRTCSPLRAWRPWRRWCRQAFWPRPPPCCQQTTRWRWRGR